MPDRRPDAARPRRRAGLLERALPDELVLYDPAGDRAWLLNRTAAAVWDLADGGRSGEEIAAELAAALGVPAETARADVARVVAELTADGVLAGGGGSGPAGEPGPHATAITPAGEDGSAGHDGAGRPPGTAEAPSSVEAAE